MLTQLTDHEEILDRLNRTVIEAAAFFAGANEHLTGSLHHTAHDALAELLFQQEQFVSVTRALLDHGTVDLAPAARDLLTQTEHTHFASATMTMMAFNFTCLQHEFDALLRRLSDWSAHFKTHPDSEAQSLADHLIAFESHIRFQIHILKQAQ